MPTHVLNMQGMSHTLVQDMTYFSVTDFEENRFLILEKIVF